MISTVPATTAMMAYSTPSKLAMDIAPPAAAGYSFKMGSSYEALICHLHNPPEPGVRRSVLSIIVVCCLQFPVLIQRER